MIPKEKITLSLQDQKNTLGYFAKAWANYNIIIEGSPMSILLYRVGKCIETNTNQTPMHLERCYSCVSQRHPDTMHNMSLLKIKGIIMRYASTTIPRP